MKTCEFVQCKNFPCTDMRHGGYVVPDVELDPDKISIVLISESAPAEKSEFYYAPGSPHFAQTTLVAFQDAGANVTSIQELLDMGVYLTAAVKCAKTGYGIQTATIKECSHLLEQELALFPKIKGFLLMGDVAIKAVNEIARRAGEGRVIPAGSTYKIRGLAYTWRGARAFPSYLQAGPSFGIEKTKRKMMQKI